MLIPTRCSRGLPAPAPDPGTPRGHPCASFLPYILWEAAHMESRPNPEIRHCRMTSSHTAPKLDGRTGSTDSTPSRYKKTLSSYDQCRMERQQKSFAHHQSSVPATGAPAPAHHFTNFTLISYEKTRNSYDQCEVPPLTASVRPALQSVRPATGSGPSFSAPIPCQFGPCRMDESGRK